MNQQIASIIIIMLNLANESSAVKLDGWKKLKQLRPEMVIGVGGCVASQEGEAIRKSVEASGNAFATFYVGPRSNRNSFLELSGAEAPEILHIATHGLSNDVGSIGDLRFNLVEHALSNFEHVCDLEHDVYSINGKSANIVLLPTGRRVEATLSQDD